MLNVSQEFQTAIAAAKRTIKIRIRMKDTLYTEIDINKFDFDSGSMGGNALGIGSTYANTIKIEFCKIIEGLQETDKITVELGVKTVEHELLSPTTDRFYVEKARIGIAQLTTVQKEKFEYVSLGEFYIKGRVDPDRNENKTTIEAMDAWFFMEGIYESQLNYPTSLRNVALEIANLSGSEIDYASFQAISSVFVEQPVGYTYRQAIGLVAQIEGGYARYNRAGKLEILSLTDSNYLITTNEYFMKGLVKNEVLFRLGGVSCKVVSRDGAGNETTTQLQSGSDKGTQIALENSLMTQQMLDDLYEKLKQINFYPYTLKWRGNPAIEAGDWLTLVDRQGNKFKVPNLNYKLTFAGGLTAISAADTKPASHITHHYKGPLRQIIESMDRRIDAAGKNTVYEGIDEPPYAKEGDIWFKPNGPDKEIWVYQRLTDGNYGWVKQVSTAPNDELLQTLGDAAKKAQEAKTNANEAVRKAEQAINEAGFTSEKVGTIEGEISEVKITMKGIQSAVSTKADQSQVTQLADQITSVVVDIEENKSQITQLSQAINLQVAQGDVIHQINISPESILISGERIQITGETYIENGIIENAKIKDISADKISTGVLNAANITVINLNASSLSTGYLSADRIKAKSIYADKLNVSSLSAISANIGTVTAGNLHAVNISGGTIDSPLYRVPSMETIVSTTWDNDHYQTQMKFTKRGLFMLTYVWEYYPMLPSSHQYNIHQIELTVIRSQESYYEKWTGSGRGAFQSVVLLLLM